MKNQKEKKPKIAFWKIASVFGILVSVFAGIGYSSFIVDKGDLTTEEEEKPGEVETGEPITVHFKYYVCDGLETIVHPEESIGSLNVSGTTIDLNNEQKISNESTYNLFFNLMAQITSNGPSSGSVLDAQKNPYVYEGSGDFSGYEILVYVNDKIETTTSSGACGGQTTTYSGLYLVKKRSPTEDTYHYSYVTDSSLELEIKSGETIPQEFLQNEIRNQNSNYTFVGLRKEIIDSQGNSSIDSTYFDLTTPLMQDTTFYAVVNFDEKLSGNRFSLSDTINSSITTMTFNAGVASEEFNLTNDLSYFDSAKVVFLNENATIAEGTTVNFGLNSGEIKTKEKNVSSNIEPENSSHSLQYKVVLQADLFINGTMVIGSNYGIKSSSQSVQGLITNEYVCLDLNGHTITINSTGRLESYGLIKDSIGTGEIKVIGGTLLTPVVIQDYRGGNMTAEMVRNQNLFPFEVFSLPYLRCKALFLPTSDGTWGRFLAFCHLCVATTGGDSYAEIQLNFIGPSDTETKFLFTLDKTTHPDASLELFGYSSNSVESELKSNEKEYCLSYRFRISLNYLTCHMDGIQFSFNFNISISPTIPSITIPVNVDTTTMIFPIPTFFDIGVYHSNLEISQQIKFMPGASFYADEDSIVLMGTKDSKISAQISILDMNYVYYDASKGQMVTKDNHTANYERGYVYRESSGLWKYYSGSRINIMGTIAFKTGNSESNSYILSGKINFNKIAYTETTDFDVEKMHYIDYQQEQNPFVELSKETPSVFLDTYNFSFLLGTTKNYIGGGSNYHLRGMALPLISNGVGYFHSGNNTDCLVGKFNDYTGVFTSNDGSSYYFNCDGDQAPRDENSVVLKQCTYDESSKTIIDSESNLSYIYFSGIYCQYTSSNNTADVSRLDNTTAVINVQYNSSLERWLRA